MLREKKTIFEFLLLSALFSGPAVCDDSFGLRLTTESSATKESTQYRFHYFVKDEKTGDYKAQEETKKGDSVQGSYTIADPNGDLRTVTYKAGPGTGFEAKVNVHPSGSPMKQTSEGTTARTTDLKTTATLESNVKRFPGGFAMNLTSPQTDVRTEMGMKFSLKTTSFPERVTDSPNTFTLEDNKTTGTTETVAETSSTNVNLESPKPVPTEGRGISEDEIEKEIDEAFNSMPKLPELVLSDNKTHLKFHKDPEEALLDERITQIARQLAETSLRREYEERKLGHFIPISLSSIESSTADYLLKSFKLTGDGAPSFRPSEPSTFHVLTQMKVIPEYIYKQTLVPSISPLQYRLPVMNKASQKPEQHTFEVINDDILKVDKPQKDSDGFILKEGARGNEQTSVMPLQVPTFFQFFSPYVMHTSESYVPQKKSEPTRATKDLMKEGTDDDSAASSSATPVNNRTS